VVTMMMQALAYLKKRQNEVRSNRFNEINYLYILSPPDDLQRI
jgi:hypothetical protein